MVSYGCIVVGVEEEYSRCRDSSSLERGQHLFDKACFDDKVFRLRNQKQVIQFESLVSWIRPNEGPTCSYNPKIEYRVEYLEFLSSFETMFD